MNDPVCALMNPPKSGFENRGWNRGIASGAQTGLSIDAHHGPHDPQMARQDRRILRLSDGRNRPFFGRILIILNLLQGLHGHLMVGCFRARRDHGRASWLISTIRRPLAWSPVVPVHQSGLVVGFSVPEFPVFLYLALAALTKLGVLRSWLLMHPYSFEKEPWVPETWRGGKAGLDSLRATGRHQGFLSLLK